MKMAKRKGDKLTLDEVEDMIEEGVLSVDEESECSEDEDFEPVSSNLPSSSESSEQRFSTFFPLRNPQNISHVSRNPCAKK